jgi:hypothetical protein
MSESAAKVQNLPLVEGQVVTGTLFSEPMRVETIRESGSGTWVVGLSGVNTERFREVTLTAADRVWSKFSCGWRIVVSPIFP